MKRQKLKNFCGFLNKQITKRIFFWDQNPVEMLVKHELSDLY